MGSDVNVILCTECVRGAVEVDGRSTSDSLPRMNTGRGFSTWVVSMGRGLVSFPWLNVFGRGMCAVTAVAFTDGGPGAAWMD